MSEAPQRPSDTQDPQRRPLDPVALELERVWTNMLWLNEHLSEIEIDGDLQSEQSKRSLVYLRACREKLWKHLEQLSRLLLAGKSIDPDLGLPSEFTNGIFPMSRRKS
jgi:hypothetical protein